MMTSLAVGAMMRLGASAGFSLSQFSLLSNRNTLLAAASSRDYARSAEDILGMDKPKRPPTPFLKFVTQMRPALQAKNPNASPKDLMKLAGKHWEQLDTDVKRKMSQEYQAQHEDYKKIKAKFEESLSEEQKQEIAALKRELSEKKERRRIKAEAKELGRPKRPLNAYFLFQQSQKDNINIKTFKTLGDYQTTMKQKWDALSPNERSKWETKAQRDKQKYQIEIQDWEEKMIEEGHLDLVKKATLRVKASKNKDE